LIQEAISSSLKQHLPDGWNIEVLVGVDGCKTTLEATLHCEEKRLRVVSFEKNHGPYHVLNSLLRISSGEVVAILDSDDFMNPLRLHKQLALLLSGYDFVGSLYDIEENGQQSHGPAAQEQVSLKNIGFPIHSSWCVKRTVYTALGGYKEWRCGADTDFWIRALAAKVRARVVQEPLFVRRVREDQLTSPSSVTGPGSVLRMRAQRSVVADLSRYRRGETPDQGTWHAQPYTICKGRPRIVVVMPTLPHRQRSAQLVVRNLLKQGASLIVVHLNGHKSIPGWAQQPRIKPVLHPQGTGPMVRWADIPDSDFVLSVDDDLIYPDDYIKQTVKHLLRVRRGRAISYHGTHWPQGKTSFEDRVILGFAEPCSTYVPKTYLGSGVSAFFYSDLEKMDRRAPELFQRLDDVWMSSVSARADILLYRPPSPHRWISVYPEQEDGIFSIEKREQFRSRKKAIAEALRLGGWKLTPTHQGLPVYE
jgi:glycosyltransferase involved in cell wall biosynthesis